MGDVSYHCHVKFAGNRAPLRQSMRGAFQHAMGHTAVHHFCQVSLDGGRIWCGDMEASVDLLVADKRIYG